MNKNIIIIAIIVLVLVVIGIGFWLFSKSDISPSAPIIPVGEESKINGDTTAAINQELPSADLDDLDAGFQEIDADLKNL